MTLTTADLWLVSDPRNPFTGGPLFPSKEEAERHVHGNRTVRTLADEIEREIDEATSNAMHED